MTDTALALHTAAPLERGAMMTREQIELLKRTIAKGTTDDEFSLFVATCNRMELDPFSRQIHCVKRWDSKEKREVMAIQVGIDGFRASAERTGECDGQEGPFWCGEDGVWKDVWTSSKPPVAAKVLVFRKGIARPFVGIARYKSYVQRKQDGEPNHMWSRGDDFMLAKCAEALALRKGFPIQLSGVHLPEELAGDDAPPADVTALPSSKSKPAIAPPAPPMTAPSGPPPGVPAPPATTTAPPAATGLTQAEVDELATALRKCGTRRSVSEQARKINGLPLTPSQREMLLAVHSEVVKLIIEAEKAEAAAAGQP